MLDFTKELCPDRPLTHSAPQTKSCRFDRYAETDDHRVLEGTEVGDYTYCFGFSDIIYTALDKFDPIATDVCIDPAQYPAKIRAATHHFTYHCSHYGLGPDDTALIDWRRQNHRVVTGNDVRLRHSVVLMSDVTLGDGAMVGAGAVVTHDVAPYEIVGEVPARHIGWCCPPELIAAMERICWWDWSHDMLGERLRDFDDATALYRRLDPQ